MERMTDVGKHRQRCIGKRNLVTTLALDPKKYHVTGNKLPSGDV